MTSSVARQPENEPETQGLLDQYIREYEGDPDYVAETMALHLAEQATRLLEKRNMSRSELADLMGVSRAYVTKILNAPPNLTLRSIATLALALGAKPSISLSTPASMKYSVSQQEGSSANHR